VTGQEIFNGTVLAVGNNASGFYASIRSMGINERRHVTCLADRTGGDFYGSDHFMKGIDGSVCFISEF